jgi:hypothetical protein
MNPAKKAMSVEGSSPSSRPSPPGEGETVAASGQYQVAGLVEVPELPILSILFILSILNPQSSILPPPCPLARPRPPFWSCIFGGMIFNDAMTIWLFAVLLITAVALAGWRQGAIRAAFSSVGIVFAALLAAPLGRLFHPLLPHVGLANPITAWAVAPVLGFILAIIPWKIGANIVHHRVEHFYRYRAGDLRLALWERLNSRLGICVGILNGSAYFVLVSFFIFNLAYWTTQTASATAIPPVSIRLVNSLGESLQSAGFSQTASAVGTLSPRYYQLADLSGLLMQNPQLGGRLANYPGLASLWHRDDFQSVVTDPTLTNAPIAGTPLNEIYNDPSVVAFLANRELSQGLEDAVATNLDDLTAYLNTGNSTKFSAEPIIGNWEFNTRVTLAWFREEQPKIGANEMRRVRALWTPAFNQTTILLTGDNQVFVQNFPKFVTVTQPNQPFFQLQDGKGDWTRDGTNYTLHVNINGEDKFLIGTTDGLRLRLKDGHTLLVFDHAD